MFPAISAEMVFSKKKKILAKNKHCHFRLLLVVFCFIMSVDYYRLLLHRLIYISVLYCNKLKKPSTLLPAQQFLIFIAIIISSLVPCLLPQDLNFNKQFVIAPCSLTQQKITAVSSSLQLLLIEA